MELFARLADEARRAAGELGDALWPWRCCLCGAASARAPACERHSLAGGPRGGRCGRCAARLPPGIPGGQTCARCRRRAPGWSRLLALGDYHAPRGLREWLLAFKHGARPDLARPLGRALAEWALECGALDGADLLVPVPLHRLRRLERGYDQAGLLAREIAGRCGLEAAGLLRRTRDTPSQGRAGAASRRANVRAAFAARRGAPARARGRRVWLVDDVVTSGATAAACAQVLRSLGAREVGVLALARVQPDERREHARAAGEYPLAP